MSKKPAKKASAKKAASKKVTKVSKTVKTAPKQRNTSHDAINNALTVVRHAIRAKISVTAASKLNGYGRNYVSNVKIAAKQNLKNKNITKTEFDTFTKEYTQYEKTVK